MLLFEQRINLNLTSRINNQMHDLLNTVLSLRRNNEFSIIPLAYKTKEPSCNWKEFQQKHPSLPEYEAWFGEAEHKNVGIVTGAISNVIVLDVDGPDGEASLATLGELPSTPTVQTGKGRHLYFKHPGFPVRNFVRIKPGLDVRGDGGYVVAPPSVHPDGSVYEWTIHPENQPFADLPSALADLIAPIERKDLPAESCTNSEETFAPFGLGGIPRAYRKEIEQLFGQLAQAKEGQRNDTLNRVAFALGQLSICGVVDGDWAQNELSAIAEQVGLSASESEATIESGFDAGISKPREDLQPFYNILDSMPEIMDRPLRLIDGKAYGATWLPIASHSDTVGKASQTEMVIFTAHGDFYSTADIPGSQPLDGLPLRIELPFVPSPDKPLSPAGFRALMRGEKPNPARLFSQVSESVDRFVSFENSLADQQLMSELVACWIMGTYFLDAFDVVGYLWPTGERGSGKTQLLNTVSVLAFLGRTTTSGSSFAAIRDEAHYGATLAFDDCEDLGNMESSKRELLLAGNTRGTVISRKEATSQNEWRTVYVNNFAPRLFSSIGLPDPVLGSRTISIPLITSLDTAKTRRSPLQAKDWLWERRALIDGLWSVGVCYLPRLRECDEEASRLSSLQARGHDIWRMPLAVAYWLQTDHGVEGVWNRLQQISEAYQSLQAENEEHDLLTLVVLAAHELAAEAEQNITVPTKVIAERVSRIAMGDEECCFELLNPREIQRVGTMMGRLGFQKAASHGSTRSWQLSRRQVDQIAKARGIPLGFQSNGLETVME